MANYHLDTSDLHDSLFDDAHLSYVSVEFAKMRPSDFKLPEYEFYQETQETWFDDEMEDYPLEDLAMSNDVDIAEDIATTVYFVFPGKPRVVDISPPASIRGQYSSSNSRPSSQFHSRSSSYSDDSHMDDRKSLDSGLSDESHDLSPSTPGSLYSNPPKTYFSRLAIPPKSQQRQQKTRDYHDTSIKSRSICT